MRITTLVLCYTDVVCVIHSVAMYCVDVLYMMVLFVGVVCCVMCVLQFV